VRRRLPAISACLALSRLMVVASTAHAQSGGWRTDERVLITDFGIVTSLARSPSSVFAATTGGLIVVDESFGGIELPITVEDGYPALPTTAMTYDDRDRSLWLAAGSELIQFDTFRRRFRDRIGVRQPVTGLVPAESSNTDLFVRIGAEWWRLDTFGRGVRRADPASVRAALDSRSDLRAREEALLDPFFLEAARQAARPSYGGAVRILDLVPTRDSHEWWLGTAGSFLIRYDDISRVGKRSPVGPAGAGMAAVLAGGDAVWFAPERPLEGRYGIAAASSDLRQWRVWRADSSRAVPDRVADLVGVAGGTWAGGESGLYWMPDGGAEWRQERAVDLSYQPVFCLAPASGAGPESVWIGTARGLIRVPAVGAGLDVSVLRSVPVRSVVEAGGSVWIGTDQGLYVMSVPDSVGQLDGGRAEGPTALGLPVGALAASGDTVYAGLDAEVWWKAGDAAPWVRLEPFGKGRAKISALAIRDGVLWVGSSAELTVLETDGGLLERFSFGPDLPPGPRGETGISDISISAAFEGWVALPAGAMRLEVRH